MMQVLSGLIVSRFYKVNAGFFLFLFIILFGILPGPDTIHLHHGLMLAAVSSPVHTLVAFIVLALYNTKCISFTAKEFDLPENGFLYNLQALSNIRQIVLLTLNHISLYSPLLLYGCITICVGVSSAHYLGSVLILLCLAVMIATGAYLSFHKINSTWKPPAFVLPSLPVFKNKGFYSYLIHYSLSNKKAAFISIKIFSLLALQFLVVLNADKVSKENVCFLIMFSIAAHSLLPAYYVRFVETEMAFLRNMPVQLPKRLGLYAFTYIIILLPELLFLLYNEINVIPLQVIASLYVLAIVRLTLYSAIQYLPNMNINKYTGVVFVMFFVTLILLASFSLWLFIVAELICTLLLFGRFYYRYEPVVMNEE